MAPKFTVTISKTNPEAAHEYLVDCNKCGSDDLREILGYFVGMIMYRVYVMLVSGLLIGACTPDTPSTNTGVVQVGEHNQLDSWQDQKFSMFIHFGLYSIPAGIWDGQQITGYSEQIKGHARIPTEEYRKLASEFNPTQWNPDTVALLAKEAGMRSIVITSKHHDGFCLFQSAFTDFDVVDATPYGRDIIKELSEACQRHGLGFGVYFSTIDWDYPGAMPFMSTRNSDSIPPAHHQYNLKQVEELLTGYGDITELWFDMGAPSYTQSKEMVELVNRLQPNCLVSGRIWNDQGDFVVMGDNYTPDFRLGVPWQTPASMFDETWSYRSWQERTHVYAKTEEKILDLLNIVSAGGNYLLNIGPKGDGSIVSYEKMVLQGIGRWMGVHGEAIYGTSPSMIDRPEWGFITEKPGKLYLHVTKIPENGIFQVDGVSLDVRRAYLLTDSTTILRTNQLEDGLRIDWPDQVLPEAVASVVVVDYSGVYTYVPAHAVRMKEGQEVVLDANNAERYHSYSGHDYYSSKPTVIRLKWHLVTYTGTSYHVEVYPPEGEIEGLDVRVDDKSIAVVDPGSQQVVPFEFDGHDIRVLDVALKNPKNPHRGLPIENLRLVIKAVR